jgi:hypothetical protein
VMFLRLPSYERVRVIRLCSHMFSERIQITYSSVVEWGLPLLFVSCFLLDSRFTEGDGLA